MSDKMLTMINVSTTYHYTKSLHYYWLYSHTLLFTPRTYFGSVYLLMTFIGLLQHISQGYFQILLAFLVSRPRTPTIILF